MSPTTPQVTPFLMFEGRAEEAMRLYVSLFENSEIESLVRYGAGQDGPEGTVQQAVFSLNGQRIRCFDSPVHHAFSFTPAVSLFVTFASAEEVDRTFAALSDGGEVLMPPGEYPFSPRFAWVQDRFGVSWQLFLEG